MDDVKKPLPVTIVEAIAWTYVALSLVGVLGAIVAECRGNGGALMSLFGILLGGSFPVAMSFGMVLSLRRGRRVWFIMPNSIVLLIFNDGMPKPGPDTYFLTPTGRCLFAWQR